MAPHIFPPPLYLPLTSPLLPHNTHRAAHRAALCLQRGKEKDEETSLVIGF